MTQAPVGTKNAIVAPIFAGVTLGLLYALIKYTNLDPGTLYRVFASLFRFICFGEILQPLLNVCTVYIFSRLLFDNLPLVIRNTEILCGLLAYTTTRRPLHF